MPTGNITLNFETPDLNLVGTGDFDVSDAFKRMFAENPSIQTELSDKISDIFKNINTEGIGENWSEKIKDSFKLDEFTPNLQKAMEDKANDVISKLKLDTTALSILPPTLSKPSTNKKKKSSSPSESSTNKKKKSPLGGGTLMDDKHFAILVKYFNTKPFKDFIKFFPQNKAFNEYLKGFSGNITKFTKSMDGFTKSSSKALQRIGKDVKPSDTSTDENDDSGFNKIRGVLERIGGDVEGGPEGGDTVFESAQDVNIVSISDKIWDRLNEAMGGGGMGKGKVKAMSEGGTEKLEKVKGKGGVVNKLMKGLLPPGVPAAIMKLSGPALLAGGLVWMAIDGIRGWMKAEDWGVSKVSGAIGGLLGGMDGGVKGAFKNAGKWALIGAAIGSVVPIIGTIAGGLIGAAVGGILGWIGGENIAKSFDKVGEWFKSNVFPELQKTWESIKKWYEEGLKPAIEEVSKKIGPILNDFGEYLKENLIPILKNLWKGIKWIGEKLGVALLWVVKNSDVIIGTILNSLETLFDAFKTIGGWIGKGAYLIYENIKSIIDDFVKLGEDIGEGAFKIVDWVVNKWKDAVDTFKKGFKSFFDWITGLGTKLKEGIISMLPDWVQNKLGGKKDDGARLIELEKREKEGRLGKGRGSEKSQTEELKELREAQKTPTKAQALVMSPDGVTFQPDNEDKLYTSGDTNLFAKPDDILGKTFTNIETQLTTLNTVFKNTVTVLDKHTEILNNMLSVDREQLGVLPSLAPIPAEPEQNEKTIPSTDIRDPVYEYRSMRYDNMRRGI